MTFFSVQNVNSKRLAAIALRFLAFYVVTFCIIYTAVMLVISNTIPGKVSTSAIAPDDIRLLAAEFVLALGGFFASHKKNGTQ